MTIQILLVEDYTAPVDGLEALLLAFDSLPKEIVGVKLLEEAVKELSDRPFDLVLLDLFLPDSQGLTTLTCLLEITCEIPIIILTDIEREHLAKEALKLGAIDYLIPGQITPELLQRSLRYAIEISRNCRLRQESERRFQAVFERSVDFMLLLNVDGIVSKINQNVVNFSKFLPKEIEGLYLWDAPVWYRDRACQKKLKNAVTKASQGEVVSYQIDMLCAEELVKTVDLSLMPVRSEKGKVVGLIATARQVSDRPSLPTEIIESREHWSQYVGAVQRDESRETERELSQMKSKFVTMVSHEFRTPMSTILLSSGLLETYSNKWSEERQKIHFERIKSAIYRLTELLDEVLVIGKAEAGKLELKPKPLNLEAFCLSLLEEWKSYVGSDRLIKFSYNGNCNKVQIDEELLKQILSHLLSNAMKYSPVDEAIDLELNCIPPLKEGEDGVAIFQVRDRGIGIPTAEQKRLFETFFRASNVGTISGAGLGLAIVRALVDLHGGQITVESEVDAGTIIKVKLPWANVSF